MHPPRARAVETLGEGDSTSGRMTGFRWNVALAAERPAWYTHSMDDVRGALAANLAELRKEENLTQAEFAAQFNYSDKAVSKWERGDSLPDVVMLKTIADLYGLRVDDLLTDGGVAAAYAAATESGGEKQHDAYLMSKVLIAAMWVTMVWVVAVVVFCIRSSASARCTGWRSCGRCRCRSPWRSSSPATGRGRRRCSACFRPCSCGARSRRFISVPAV